MLKKHKFWAYAMMACAVMAMVTGHDMVKGK